MKDPRAITIDLVGIVACVVLSLGAFVVGVRPVLRAGVDQNHTIQELAATGGKADQASQNALRAEQHHAEVLKKSHDAEFVLYGPGDRLQRLRALSDLASRCGLLVQTLDPAAPEARGEHLAYPMRVTGRGTFAGVIAFFEGLHGEFQDVRAVRCRLMRSVVSTGKDDSRGTATSEFEFGLVWFAVRDGSIVTAPDSAP